MSVVDDYLRIKSLFPGLVVFYRIGEFYEIFLEDAKLISENFGFHLTQKSDKNGLLVPMCGIPQKAKNTLVIKLLKLDKRIAVFEEHKEDNKISRVFKEIITPGNVYDADLVDQIDPSILVLNTNIKNHSIELMLIDISTGIKSYHTIHLLDLSSFIAVHNPGDILIITNEKMVNEISFCGFKLPDFIQKFAEKTTQVYVDEDDKNTLDVAIDKYIKFTIPGYLVPKKTSSEIQFLKIDSSTIKNLNLLDVGGKKKNSIFDHLDLSRTKIGSRVIKGSILYPHNDLIKINNRLNAVDFFIQNKGKLEEVSYFLDEIKDVHRILSRITNKKARLIDYFHIAQSIDFAIKCAKNLSKEYVFGFLKLSKIEKLSCVSVLISNSISYDEETTSISCNINASPLIKQYNESLTNLKNDLDLIESKCRRDYGVEKIKMIYVKGVGYCIEVEEKLSNKVEGLNFVLIKNKKAYFNNENIVKLTSKYNFIKEKIEVENTNILCAIDDVIINLEQDIIGLADAIGEIDLIASFARVALRYGYNKPCFDQGQIINIVDGWHPLLKQIQPQENSIELTAEDNLMIVFGPNMSGKSTFLKQNAIIAIMCHVGSFVPAKSCRIGVMDSIFTRIGSDDNILENKSTFFSEMADLAGIFKNATSRSFYIIDEVGRGTTYFEGIEIAKECCKYIMEKRIGMCALSTHYYEICSEDELKNKIYHFDYSDDLLEYNHQLKKGIPPYKTSMAVNVAKKAGIPDELTRRFAEKINQYNK